MDSDVRISGRLSFELPPPPLQAASATVAAAAFRGPQARKLQERRRKLPDSGSQPQAAWYCRGL